MKKYISLIAVFLTVGIAGCKKDYLSLENNPNQPSITTPDLALSAAEVGAAYVTQVGYPQYGVWGGFWTTSGNYVPNATINEYQITTGSFLLPDGNSLWTDWYLNLANFNTLQTIAAGSSATANYQAIAMIMKAYGFAQLVDNYNNVPYSQAFDTKNTTPAYDNGIDIYHDLGKQLDAAIALIKKSPGAIGPTTSDVIFGGDMTAWIKFANSLRLRLAIRVSTNIGASDPLVTDLASTSSEGYLDGTLSAVANPGYSGTNSGSGISQENPFYGEYGADVTNNPTFGNLYYRANDFAVRFYTSTNDPRLAAFYAKTTGGAYRGNIFGDTQGNLQNPFTSGIGPGLLTGPTQGAVLFSGAESLFLQAEALFNGINIGTTPEFATAQLAYEAGITASFESLGLTDAQASAYYAQALNNVSYTASTNKETAIITQKWASLNGLFNLEAYNDYRRTGVPVLPSSVDPSAIASTLPKRILYPTSELSTNPANIAKQGTISPITSKIFWAK
jgi:hypothetical protein